MPKTSAKKTLFIDPESDGSFDWGIPVDQYGHPVERTKQQCRYSYSPYVTWRQPGTQGPGKHAVYSDRLFQWDPAKHDRLCMKHFENQGQVWSSRAPAAIQAFLRDYFDKEDLVLELVMEGCNPSNGFPYWVFYYR